jgi:hypothetical protein
MARAGRNEPCPCGSGQKYKRCCETSAGQTRTRTMVLVIVGAVLAVILVGFALMDRDRGAGPNRVWSAEHGHYH